MNSCMELVRILGFIWNMYGVIGFTLWSRVLPSLNCGFGFCMELCIALYGLC